MVRLLDSRSAVTPTRRAAFFAMFRFENFGLSADEEIFKENQNIKLCNGLCLSDPSPVRVAEDFTKTELKLL
jgi:hypothetical protein